MKIQNTNKILSCYLISSFQECKPLDSDQCLRNSEDWDDLSTCEDAIRDDPHSCQTKARDMRRCCPETCGTGQFTEHDCDAWKSGSGTCIYPNDAQCIDKG